MARSVVSPVITAVEEAYYKAIYYRNQATHEDEYKALDLTVQELSAIMISLSAF